MRGRYIRRGKQVARFVDMDRDHRHVEVVRQPQRSGQQAIQLRHRRTLIHIRMSHPDLDAKPMITPFVPSIRDMVYE